METQERLSDSCRDAQLRNLGLQRETGRRTAEPVLTVLGGQSLPAGHFYLVGVGQGRKPRACVGPSGLRAQGMGKAGGEGVGRGPTLF